jgi:hypothetical protein
MEIYNLSEREDYKFLELKIQDYFTNNFIIIEIKNPNTPIIKIPAAVTFATFMNSSLVGFFKTAHTLLHFSKKDFNLVNIFLID